MSRKHHQDRARRGKFGGVLEQFVVAIADGYVQEFKDDPEAARQRANFAMSVIQSNAGGAGIYIGKGHLWHISEVHRRIYSRFTGNNHAQLAREFNLTERQIYNIIAAVGDEEFERRQGKLF
jgi:Mor family transcriptional regulator